MQRKQFEHAGMNSASYNEIPSNSDFEISGMGNVTINSINENVTINKSGMGKLTINGSISEKNVRIISSGMGHIYFAKQPPQSVVIEKSGMGEIYIVGKKFSPLLSSPSQSAPSVIRSSVISGSSGGIGSVIASGGSVTITKNGIKTTYKGNSIRITNGNIILDGKPVVPNDSRIIRTIEEKKDSASMILHALGGPAAPGHRHGHDSDSDNDNDGAFPGLADAIRASVAAPAADAKAAAGPAPIADPIPDAKKSQEPAKSDIDLNPYSKHMQGYLATFKDKIPLSKRIEEVLQSVPEAEERFAEFIDPITESYMDIPVSLNEKYYNLDTLRTWHAQNKGDPLTREPFTLGEIQSARQLYNKADELVKQVMSEYQEKQKLAKDSDEAHDGVPIAPGGPGMRRAV
jgi:hypothetical protein